MPFDVLAAPVCIHEIQTLILELEIFNPHPSSPCAFFVCFDCIYTCIHHPVGFEIHLYLGRPLPLTPSTSSTLP